MRKIILFLIAALAVYNTRAQEKKRVYRTAEGIVYSATQLDSIKKLGLPIGIIKDTLVHDTLFRLVKIYGSSVELRTFTTKFKGKVMPAVVFRDMKGLEINTTALKGKLIMINFWSVTCGPCIAEIPQLNQLREKYKDKVVFIATLPEGKAEAIKFLEKTPYNFTIAPGAATVFKELGIDGYPKNFFIDDKGIIKEVKEGTPITMDKSTAGFHVDLLNQYGEILEKLIAGKL